MASTLKKRTSAAGAMAFHMLINGKSGRSVVRRASRVLKEGTDGEKDEEEVFDVAWAGTKTPTAMLKKEEKRSRKRIVSEDWRERRASALEIAASVMDDVFEYSEPPSYDEPEKEEESEDGLEKALNKAEQEFRKALNAQAYWFKKAFDLRKRLEYLHGQEDLKTGRTEPDGAPITNEMNLDCSSVHLDSLPSPFNSVGTAPPHVQRTFVMMFNRKPKKGVAYAKLAGLCDSPGSIARYLINTPGLSKIALGEYLSNSAAMNIQVADSYFKHTISQSEEWINAVKDENLVDALEHFFSGIHPPGEAGPLERLINRFTSMYYTSNPDQFESKDTIYVLTHALLMLNSSLHKKAASKYRLSIDDFASDVRRSADCKNVSVEWLQKTYRRLKRSPLQVHGALSSSSSGRRRSPSNSKSHWYGSSSSSSKDNASGDESMGKFLHIYPTRTGWALKENKDRNARQKRYFVLIDHTLFYFRQDDDSVPHSAVPLHGCKVSMKRDGNGKHIYVILEHSSGAPFLQIHKNIENRNEFRMCFSNANEAKAWHDAINLQVNLTHVALKHHHGWDRASSESINKPTGIKSSPDVRGVLTAALGKKTSSSSSSGSRSSPVLRGNLSRRKFI